MRPRRSWIRVAGDPSAWVSRLLDSAVDRADRGEAVVWRFSPASVRRAMDEGIGTDELRAQLSAMATGELPQPPRYLSDDAARRHGQLRLTPAGTYLVIDDLQLSGDMVFAWCELRNDERVFTVSRIRSVVPA